MTAGTLDDLIGCSPGQRFALEYRRTGRHRDSRITVEARALIESGSDSAGGAWVGGGTPVGVSTERAGWLANLIPVVPTELGRVPFVRELNPQTSEQGASAVPEAGEKPEASMTFAGGELAHSKVVAWLPMTREIRDDAPALATYVDNRLLHMLRIREEGELLTGTGTDGRMTGFLNDPDIRTASGAASAADAAVKGLTAIENAGAKASGVVVYPGDFWASYATAHGFWSRLAEQGLTVVRTPAIPEGTILVGGFAGGSLIWRRQAGEIRISDSHEHWFLENKLAVVAELREVLEVGAPGAFCKVTLS